MTAPTILMIRPVRFGYNAETAVNNAFQTDVSSHADGRSSEASAHIQARALAEFDSFTAKLEEAGVPLLIIPDTPDPHTPDSIFPNNWITTHADGHIVLYPMFAGNRRLERKTTVMDSIRQHFKVGEISDFSIHEVSGRFLEGTGSFILDRERRMAYACLSPRTDEGLFREFCEKLGYQPIVFRAYDRQGVAIYHTNVMMCVADRYAVVNMECVVPEDREMVRAALQNSGKEIIGISQEQMERFAGNMLQVFNRMGEGLLVMSSQAFESLETGQILALEKYNKILHSPLETIESNGGGSARCMMAEIYLQKK